VAWTGVRLTCPGRGDLRPGLFAIRTASLSLLYGSLPADRYTPTMAAWQNGGGIDLDSATRVIQR
jgi:hypothetical protein